MDRKSSAGHGPGPGFTARSQGFRATPAGMVAATRTKLVFASEWYFKPKGVTLVKKRFDAGLRDLQSDGVQFHDSVDAHWSDDDQIFRVLCDRLDTTAVWRCFHQVLSGVIRQELRAANPDVDLTDDDFGFSFEDEESLESDLIERLTLWRKEHGILNATSELLEPEPELGQDEGQVPPGVVIPDHIKACNFRQKWSCDLTGHDFDILLPDQVMEQLASLTCCKLEINLKVDLVWIGADDEEKLRLAKNKLDHIRQLWDYRAPYVNHVFYSETMEKVRYVLKYIVDIKIHYFETTLLDNVSVVFHQGICDYDTLTDAVTIRCAPYDSKKSVYIPIKNLHISPIVAAGVSGQFGGFKAGFKYAGKGSLADNPMRYVTKPVPPSAVASPPPPDAHGQEGPNLPPMNTGPQVAVQAWANTVPEIIDPPVSLTVTSQTITGSATSSTNEGLPKKPTRNAWDTYREYSPEKVNKEKEKMKTNMSSKNLVRAVGVLGQSNVPSRLFSPPLRGQKDTSQGSGAPRSVSQPPYQVNSEMTVLQPVVLHQLQPIALQQLPRFQADDQAENRVPVPAPRAVNPMFTINESLDIFIVPSVPRSFLDDSVSMMEFPVLQPQPVNQLPVHSHSRPGAPAVKHTTIDEEDTRVFKQTMSQKASKPIAISPFASGRLEKPSLIISARELELAAPLDPLPDFIERLNVSFDELIRDPGLRGFRGHIVVQAEFGRAIMRGFPRKRISGKESDFLLEQEDVHRMLVNNPMHGPSTFFTNVLTTVPAEIQFMVDMKTTGGKRLWQTAPSWSINYEFIYTDQSISPPAPFVIKIDAETFVPQVKTRRTLGNIYVHGTKRHWDFRINATGYESSRALEEVYGQLASEIESSLYIPKDLESPVLCWQVDNLLKNRYRLEHLNVRRICNYPSVDHKSTLKVVHVQAMDVMGGAIGGKGFSVYQAKPTPANVDPAKKLPLWYEASIICPQLHTFLERNKSLELGEDASWTPEAIANMDAAKSLWAPALDMLKQMDGVGLTSKNNSDYRSRPASMHPAVLSRAVSTNMGPYQFW